MILWLLEFCLELAGGWFAFQGRIKHFWVYLWFMAASDAAVFPFYFVSRQAYSQAYFAQHALAYVLLSALLVRVCGKIMGDNERTIRIYQYICSILFVGAAVCWFGSHPVTMASILRFECIANAALASLVLCCLGEAGKVEQPWKGIIVGALLLSAVNALLCIAEIYGLEKAADFRWVGEVAALILWLLSAWPRKSEEPEPVTFSDAELERLWEL